MTTREIWTVMHGMGFGGLFLLAFSGACIGLLFLGSSPQGNSNQTPFTKRFLVPYTSIMAILAWLAVLSGTYRIYPWYRATPSVEGNLTGYPRSFLKANDALVNWHNFGMEWKEHVAWFAPILATCVAFLVWQYADELTRNRTLRRFTLGLLCTAFACAAIAGGLGALLNKVAPVV
jgi:hypothetical protein